MSTALLKATKIAGSRRALAKAIGATPDAINGWLNRGVQIPLQYAIEIDRFTLGIVTWTELTPHLAYFVKCWAGFLIINRSCRIKTIPIVLSSIKCQCSSNVGSPAFLILSADIKENGLKRPICVSSENALIFGEKRLQVFEALDKKTIPAWQLSLQDLLQGKYPSEEIKHVFTLNELVDIGIALEKRLKGRRGRYNPENFPDYKGKDTRDIIAKRLGFKNGKTYELVKKINLYGAHELSQSVNSGRLALSAAALLAQLPKRQQQHILALSDKEVASTISQLRNQKKSSPLPHSLPTKGAL